MSKTKVDYTDIMYAPVHTSAWRHDATGVYRLTCTRDNQKIWLSPKGGMQAGYINDPYYMRKIKQKLQVQSNSYCYVQAKYEVENKMIRIIERIEFDDAEHWFKIPDEGIPPVASGQ